MSRILNRIVTRSITATKTASVALAIVMIAVPLPIIADDDAVIVNVDNFARAETAAQFDRAVEAAGGINQFPTSATVI